ncbi:hypothetical protein HYU94_03560 [Candidatus Daviesbacteria bacterium]|nr:hypothetical protein [Candidatus Daviesbacteria bacterium]
MSKYKRLIIVIVGYAVLAYLVNQYIYKTNLGLVVILGLILSAVMFVQIKKKG